MLEYEIYLELKVALLIAVNDVEPSNTTTDTPLQEYFSNFKCNIIESPFATEAYEQLKVVCGNKK
jgi:hypothetical protein